ncbi:hypothetical protein [Mycobacterium sp. URHB0021]
MLLMRDHGVEDYEALPHMDTTDVGDLHDDDRACLEEIGQYLVTTDAWQRFGIWLLHKHFEPAPGEVFVEHSLRSPRRTETTPIERSTFSQEALSTTAIRFGDSVSDDVDVIGMEFAQPDDFGGTSPLSDDDEAVLAGLAERLRGHDKIERFGVRLIRNPLSLAAHEMLHETCDSSTRTMHCTVGERDAMLADQATIQTAWRWRVVQGGSEAVVMQDCTAGCVRVGEGHDLAHTASGTDDFDNPTEGGPNQPF